jgi:O-antigen/teichoic acid export membrane protein
VGVAAAFASQAPLAAYLGVFLAVSLLHPLLASWGLRRAGLRAAAGALPPPLLARVRPHLYWTLLLACSGALTNKAIETYLLNRLWSAESVAYFNIAAALTRGGVELLSSGFSAVLMPSMAHAFGAEGLPRVQRITADAVRFLQLLGFALAGVGFFWARPVIVWMYGAHYLPAVPALQVMLVVGGLGLTNGAFGALLSTTDHQGMRALVACLSLLISLVCAMSLVPAFGLAGALASNAIATLAVLALIALLVHRKLDIRLPWRDCGRLALAAAAGAVAGGACIVAWPTTAGGFFAGLAFAAAYLPATVALRFWRAEDRALLSRLPLPAGLRQRLAPPGTR